MKSIRAMDFEKPLIPGTLIKRYKRFLADVRLDDGTIITAHCPNSGSMATCSTSGSPVLLSYHDDPKRKLKYTWEMVFENNGWIGVNTSNPNKVVREWIAQGKIDTLHGYSTVVPEVRYGQSMGSRIDLLLKGHAHLPDCYVEIKNCTFKVGDAVAFPDAVTTRGQKHLEELMHVVSLGYRAVIFFFVGRSDVSVFRAASEIDPTYATLPDKSLHHGVEAVAHMAYFEPQRIAYNKQIALLHSLLS